MQWLTVLLPTNRTQWVRTDTLATCSSAHRTIEWAQVEGRPKNRVGMPVEVCTVMVKYSLFLLKESSGLTEGRDSITFSISSRVSFFLALIVSINLVATWVSGRAVINTTLIVFILKKSWRKKWLERAVLNIRERAKSWQQHTMFSWGLLLKLTISGFAVILELRGGFWGNKRTVLHWNRIYKVFVDAQSDAACEHFRDEAHAGVVLPPLHHRRPGEGQDERRRRRRRRGWRRDCGQMLIDIKSWIDCECGGKKLTILPSSSWTWSCSDGEQTTGLVCNTKLINTKKLEQNGRESWAIKTIHNNWV